MAVMSTYDKHFIDVRRAFALRRDLPLRTKGLLIFLLAVPKEWGFDSDSLPEHLGETEEDIRLLLEELVREGYIIQTQREDGTLAYGVYDEPQNVEDEEEEEVYA